MDFYAPPPASDKRAKRPVVVLIHGGSFIGGDKSSWAPLATVLAQRGFVVGSINYRLTGKHWGTHEYCCPGNLSDQCQSPQPRAPHVPVRPYPWTLHDLGSQRTSSKKIRPLAHSPIPICPLIH